MKALATVLVRVLSHCFHEVLWAKGAFMRCMETYRLISFIGSPNPVQIKVITSLANQKFINNTQAEMKIINTHKMFLSVRCCV